MPVQVRIPPMLREATGGARTVEGHGSTVGAVLLDIDRQHPGFRERLFSEDGELRRFVNVYVNDEDIRFLGGEQYQFQDGDEVLLIPSIAGGC